MQIDAVITLANAHTKIEFSAMERSLRATGSTVPLLVIPYDDQKFPLPAGSLWWEVPEVLALVKKAHPMFRKYQCLTTHHYHFVDTDCIFLRDPTTALSHVHGFITCCGHWRDASHTTTAKTREILHARSTLWQRSVFNAGQFACDTVLYTADSLAKVVDEMTDLNTDAFHDQPAMNFLVMRSGVSIHNLTLPPYCVESSWAGDYPKEFKRYWTDPARAPYMIHWAGVSIDGSRPIDQLFFQYLSSEEQAEFCRPPRRKWSRFFGGS